MSYFHKEETLTFKQIMLGHYKKILEISTNEFTGGYWNYTSAGTSTTKSYVTDKRKEFIQSIEILALALNPYQDETTQTSHKKYLSDKKDLGEQNKDKAIELAKDLFKELSDLLFRLNYFKEALYGETSSDDNEEVVDEEYEEEI